MSKWRNPPPVVVLSGTHNYLRNRELREAITVSDVEGRSVEYLKGSDKDELLRVLSGAGVFFQEEVLVVVDEPENIDTDLVLRHHEREDPSAVLVLHQKGDVKAKTNLGKICKELPDRFVAKFTLPKPWEEAEHAADFCVEEARQRGLTLSSALALALVKNVGSNLGVLSFEIRKLSFYLASLGESQVKPEHLKSTIASFYELGPKPIVEALEKKSLRLLSSALANMRRTHAGNPGGATLLACAWVGRSAIKWLHVSSLLEEGYKTGEISARVGVHEFVVRKNLVPVARRWGKSRLTDLVKSVAKVERSVRSGHVNPWVEFECALFGVMGEGDG